MKGHNFRCRLTGDMRAYLLKASRSSMKSLGTSRFISLIMTIRHVARLAKIQRVKHCPLIRNLFDFTQWKNLRAHQMDRQRKIAPPAPHILGHATYPNEIDKARRVWKITWSSTWAIAFLKNGFTLFTIVGESIWKQTCANYIKRVDAIPKMGTS